MLVPREATNFLLPEGRAVNLGGRYERREKIKDGRMRPDTSPLNLLVSPVSTTLPLTPWGGACHRAARRGTMTATRR